MGGVSVETPYCCVCGRTHLLNRHHVVKRSAGNLYVDGVKMPKPTLMLCGNGNASGCHGLAHRNMLHFRWVRRDATNGPWYLTHVKGGHWEYLMTDEPCKYQEALKMDGWRPLVSMDAGC